MYRIMSAQYAAVVDANNASGVEEGEEINKEIPITTTENANVDTTENANVDTTDANANTAVLDTTINADGENTTVVNDNATNTANATDNVDNVDNANVDTANATNTANAEAPVTNNNLVVKLLSQEEINDPSTKGDKYVILDGNVYKYDVNAAEDNKGEELNDVTIKEQILTAVNAKQEGGRRRSRRNSRRGSRQSKKRQQKRQSKKRQQGGKKRHGRNSKRNHKK